MIRTQLVWKNIFQKYVQAFDNNKALNLNYMYFNIILVAEGIYI